MTTVTQLLTVAESQVGYVETGGTTGHNGNITKYWADLDASLEGSSWCAVFVSWVWKQAGHPLPPIDRPYGYINCASAVNYAKAHGLWDESGHYAPGDIVLYDFDGHGVAGHTGIVVADDGRHLTTVEGNTSPGTGGSQANGGGVYLRHRPHGPSVLGVLKSSTWLGPTPTPHPAPAPVQEDDMATAVLTGGGANVGVVAGLPFVIQDPGTLAEVGKKAAASDGVVNITKGEMDLVLASIKAAK